MQHCPGCKKEIDWNNVPYREPQTKDLFCSRKCCDDAYFRQGFATLLLTPIVVLGFVILFRGVVKVNPASSRSPKTAEDAGGGVGEPDGGRRQDRLPAYPRILHMRD